MRKLMALAIVALALGSACNAFNPLERDSEEAGVQITVDECEQDRTTDLVNVTFTVNSENDYDTVLIDAKLRDASGTVVGTSSTSVSNVKAGEPTQGVMTLSPQGDFEKPLECDLQLNFAQQPLG
jgi:hypothetical protein